MPILIEIQWYAIILYFIQPSLLFEARLDQRRFRHVIQLIRVYLLEAHLTLRLFFEKLGPSFINLIPDIATSVHHLF